MYRETLVEISKIVYFYKTLIVSLKLYESNDYISFIL